MSDPGPDTPDTSDVSDVASDLPRMDRRRLLVRGGVGGALLLGGAALGRGTAQGQPLDAGGHEGHAGEVDDASGVAHAGAAHDDLERLGLVQGGYGHGPQPPRTLDEELIDALTHPPAQSTESGEVSVEVTETRWAVAEGATVDAWTYGGRVPGPLLRTTVGERLRVTVDNRTGRGHNLHLHGRHDPQMDGWEPIPPGDSFTYDVTPGPAGLHPYHCHLPPYAEHLRRGLYGLMIVDPPGGRPPATEVTLVLSGFDLTGSGTNDVYAFNGICGLYDRHPIVVPAGELVRVYVANMVEGEAVGSFHLHAQTFDVYRTGTGDTPDGHTDTVTMGQGERAMLEFRLPAKGRYMFHPHQHHMVERGAMGWFTAV